MHVRRSILRGAVDLAAHGAIRDLDRWLLTPLTACGDMEPIALARDHWNRVSEWIRTLFLTPLPDRAYILFDEPQAQVEVSKMWERDRALLRE